MIKFSLLSRYFIKFIDIEYLIEYLEINKNNFEEKYKMTDNTLKISEIVIQSSKELGEERENEKLINAGPDTQLYGADGSLDSLSLVLLISIIEEKIFDEFSKSITLADEKAMSQRNSPFRSVKSLSDYINELLNDGN